MMLIGYLQEQSVTIRATMKVCSTGEEGLEGRSSDLRSSRRWARAQQREGDSASPVQYTEEAAAVSIVQ